MNNPKQAHVYIIFVDAMFNDNVYFFIKLNFEQLFIVNGIS